MRSLITSSWPTSPSPPGWPLVLFVFLGLSAAGWAEVPLITNGNSPAEGVIRVPLEERWRIGGAEDGRVLIASARNEYLVDVHGPGGELEMSITRPYESWKRTDAEEDRARELMMPLRPRNRNSVKIVVEPTEPDIIDMVALPHGQLQVLSSRGIREQAAGVHSTWDLFDASGAFARQVAYLCEGEGMKDALFFPGGGLAVLVKEHSEAMFAFRGRGADNPDDTEEDLQALPLEVICYRIR